MPTRRSCPAHQPKPPSPRQLKEHQHLPTPACWGDEIKAQPSLRHTGACHATRAATGFYRTWQSTIDHNKLPLHHLMPTVPPTCPPVPSEKKTKTSAQECSTKVQVASHHAIGMVRATYRASSYPCLHVYGDVVTCPCAVSLAAASANKHCPWPSNPTDCIPHGS